MAVVISAASADVKIDLKTDEKVKTIENEKAKTDEKGKFWNEDPKLSERAATIEVESDDHVSSKEI